MFKRYRVVDIRFHGDIRKLGQPLSQFRVFDNIEKRDSLEGVEIAQNVGRRNILSNLGRKTPCLRDNLAVAVELKCDLLEVSVKNLHFGV